MNVGHPYPVEISSPRDSSYGDEYTVTWEKPIDGGLPITAYEFKYRRVCVSVCVECIYCVLFSISRCAAEILSRMFFVIVILAAHLHVVLVSVIKSRVY